MGFFIGVYVCVSVGLALNKRTRKATAAKSLKTAVDKKMHYLLLKFWRKLYMDTSIQKLKSFDFINLIH